MSSASDGKICYVEIPAVNVRASADFYHAALGWKIRTRSDGELAFDDATGGVSGSWVLGRKPQSEPSVLIYVMVDSIDQTLARIANAHGRVVTPKTMMGSYGEAVATFQDPAGNLMGLYEERSR